MSRHEGVSCDSCMKANFRGRRYKCLVCFDYDLCSTCYEAGATTTRHTADHSMQCILTRADFDLYYGGEALSAEQPQAFACPYCAKLGYTETSLQEHVVADHPEAPNEVVCPICAALPGGDPNHVTDDFAGHLQLEHRAARDFEEPMGIRHVRRIPHPRGGARSRRSNMQFHTTSGGSSGSAVGGGAGTLAGLAPTSRESMDPIAELLSQLSSVRSRAAAAQNVSSQLQQLEMQLQSTRQQLERLPRRPAEKSGTSGQSSNTQTQQTPAALLDFAGAVMSTGLGVTNSKNTSSDYLLSKIGDAELSEADKQNLEVERADRSIFVQELLLSSMSEVLRLDDESIINNTSSINNSADSFLNGSDSLSGDVEYLGNNEENVSGQIGKREPCIQSRNNSKSVGNSSEKCNNQAASEVVKAEASVIDDSSSISRGATSQLLGIANSNTVSGNTISSAAVANLASPSTSTLPKEKVPSKRKVTVATRQCDNTAAANLDNPPASYVKQ